MEELEFDQAEDDEAEKEETEEDGDDDDPGGDTSRRYLRPILSRVKSNIGILVKLLQDLVEGRDTEASQGGEAEHVEPSTELVCHQVGSDVHRHAVLVARQGERSTAGVDTVSPGHGAVEVKRERLGRLRSNKD